MSQHRARVPPSPARAQEQQAGSPSPSGAKADSDPPLFGRKAAAEPAPDRASRGKSGRNVVFSISGLALLGLMVWAVLAFRLHNALTFHESELSRSPIVRQTGSLRADSVGAGVQSVTADKAGSPDRRVQSRSNRKPTTKRRLSPPAVLQDQSPSLQDGAAGEPLADGLRYALVPRPQFLEPLRAADPTVSSSSTPTLWWVSKDNSSIPEDRSQASWALAAFEKALGAAAAAASPMSAAIPVGGVAVAIMPTRKDARMLCARLAGWPDLARYTGNDVVAEDAEMAGEWHFAVRWDGRLAVCAAGSAGAFRFAATLLQLLSQTSGDDQSASTERSRQSKLAALPNFLLEDWPRHSWRGLHLDAVRHFMPVSFVKQYITALSHYKANYFHWHLTDDQAFRLYLPSRPELVRSSAETSPEFYSQQDVKDVIAHASQHFVTVVPVIETPGHVLSSLAAYPDLACKGDHFEVPKTREGTYYDVFCVGKASTYKFAVDVFTDVANLFPGKYIHIGGDETPPEKWANSEHVKAFAGMAGLRNLGPDIMEAWFCIVGRIMKKLGRTPIMWDDHFPERERGMVSKLCPHAEEDWIVQAWKMKPPVGESSEASISPRFQFRSIASPMRSVYLDYPVASIDFNKTLDLLPQTGPLILGGCATMWTEDSEPKDVGAKVYPRYMGISERLWGGVVRADQPRHFDLPLWTAAQQHCSRGGQLPQLLGFKCGKFALKAGGRSPLWKDARVTTNIDAFAQQFGPERVLDDEEETYFWGISPKNGDFFEVAFISGRTSHKYALGKWFTRIKVFTGSKDRPGDQLDQGVLKIGQWVNKSGKDNAQGYTLRWSTAASFVKGGCELQDGILLDGPTAVIKIVSTSNQMKWMALPEIETVLLEASPAHPSEADIGHGKSTADSSEDFAPRMPDAFAWFRGGGGDSQEDTPPDQKQTRRFDMLTQKIKEAAGAELKKKSAGHAGHEHGKGGHGGQSRHGHAGHGGHGRQGHAGHGGHDTRHGGHNRGSHQKTSR
eukprot:TRINITY_DN14576_c0_g1_i1.p1 TRINITY_DN14576_c0_g1~~TRINITY_DN14576_c0_g1_i1.p1  ORF type:complete len:1012 (+),score=156.79 TRINITY_DN14576_c0_g1_i1:83-3118(+)